MPRAFWAEGLRFECQQTGRCCTSHGEYGYVYLTREDRRRLAAHLGIDVRELLRLHCAVTEGHVHLKDPDSGLSLPRGAALQRLRGPPDAVPHLALLARQHEGANVA